VARQVLGGRVHGCQVVFIKILCNVVHGGA
jgi:hypothetical protein